MQLSIPIYFQNALCHYTFISQFSINLISIACCLLETSVDHTNTDVIRNANGSYGTTELCSHGEVEQPVLLDLSADNGNGNTGEGKESNDGDPRYRLK